MRSILYSILAAIILVPAWTCHQRGDAWGAISFALGAFAVFMIPMLEQKSVSEERSPLDAWLRPGREV